MISGGPRDIQDNQASWPLFITDLNTQVQCILASFNHFQPRMSPHPHPFSAEASNAYLDGLSLWRTASNQPFCSVQWGPVAEVGMASKERSMGEVLKDSEGCLKFSFFFFFHSFCRIRTVLVTDPSSFCFIARLMSVSSS